MLHININYRTKKKAIMNISQRMQDAFNKQIVAELWSSNIYLQMAFWFRKEGWKGFAKLDV